MLFFILIFLKFKSVFNQEKSNILYLIIPILFSFFISNQIFKKSNDSSGRYQSVTNRIEQTANLKDASVNERFNMWNNAVTMIQKNPITGFGLGNWKIESIPYEKTTANDHQISNHPHNDFLEMFADLGIIGGFAFLFLFILLGLAVLKIWKQSNDHSARLVASIALMAIACYFVDAFFNFPAERTSMQTMFAISAALLLTPLHFIPLKQSEKSTGRFGIVFLIVATLLIIGSIYVNYQTYTSLKVQKFVMGEINEDPKMALDEVKDAFPEIPNLSTSTLPIKALVARYHLRDKQYDEAMRLLNESDNVNPYLHYNDFIKTAVYSTQLKYDSTFVYAKKAFYNWPRATSYYKNMIFAAAKMKDTAEATKAFKTYTKYRNTAEGWNQYLLALIEINKTPIASTRALLDSAVKKFPTDSAVFVKTSSLIYGNAVMNGALPNYAVLGAQAFQKGQYNNAANLYMKASIADPSNYTHFENVGICFYTAKSFDKAIQYFNRAIDLPTANTGKSEFFKAMSYISLGNRVAACSALQAAKVKKYPGVDAQIAQYCK